MRLRGTAPILDRVTDVKSDSLDSGSRKRAMMATDSGDDALAEKYGRSNDSVAKASMDELTGNWLVNQNGKIDEDAATGTLMAVMVLKSGSETLEADAVDSYDQAVPHEEVVVELASTCVSGTTLWSDTNVVCGLKRQLLQRRLAGLSWVEHLAGMVFWPMVFLCSLIERVSHLRSWVNSVTRYPVVVAFVRNLSNSHQWLVHRCQRTRARHLAASKTHCSGFQHDSQPDP